MEFEIGHLAPSSKIDSHGPVVPVFTVAGFRATAAGWKKALPLMQQPADISNFFGGAAQEQRKEKEAVQLAAISASLGGRLEMKSSGYVFIRLSQ
jgi:hypothetical protein